MPVGFMISHQGLVRTLLKRYDTLQKIDKIRISIDGERFDFDGARYPVNGGTTPVGVPNDMKTYMKIIKMESFCKKNITWGLGMSITSTFILSLIGFFYLANVDGSALASPFSILVCFVLLYFF